MPPAPFKPAPGLGSTAIPTHFLAVREFVWISIDNGATGKWRASPPRGAELA
jgi:hypothetical protein